MSGGSFVVSHTITGPRLVLFPIWWCGRYAPSTFFRSNFKLFAQTYLKHTATPTNYSRHAVKCSAVHMHRPSTMNKRLAQQGSVLRRKKMHAMRQMTLNIAFRKGPQTSFIPVTPFIPLTRRSALNPFIPFISYIPFIHFIPCIPVIQLKAL